ncbi:MAG: hypothetical protein LUF04_01605, partial [Bacteroides sp.]|nr:hypothetical protein [Bacteroides sp.]
YIKVCPFIAEQLGLTDIRQQTADGNYLLWQQDVAAIQGETLEERSRYIGGAILDARSGKKEWKGTEEPVPLMETSEEDLPEEETPDEEHIGEEKTGEEETGEDNPEGDLETPPVADNTNEIKERRKRK